MTPWAPRRPCTYRLCPNLQPCPTHGKRPWEHQRPGSTERGYGAAWRATRARILERDGHLCVPCRTEGRTQPATMVDHVTPKNLGGTGDDSNLRAICKQCHDSKSAREGQAASMKARP